MSIFSEKYGFSEEKVYDCHYHVTRQYPIEMSAEFLRMQREYLGLEKMVLLALTQGAREVDPSNNIKALYLKESDKGNIYAFAALHYHEDKSDTPQSILEQIKFYDKAGFDGIKMLEGKPDYHRRLNCRLDSDLYDLFFAYAEERQIPLLIHVGDPVGSDVSAEERDALHDEVENVLKKHPKLRITFAHLLFLSGKREKLMRLLETYPNISVDLSIGGGYLFDFSKDIEAWRAFLLRYNERILYGSDNYNMFFEGDDDYEITGRHMPMRDFLENKEEFVTELFRRYAAPGAPDKYIKPALLPKEAVDNIYRNNFIRLYGKKPRTVDYKLAYQYTEQLLEKYEAGTLRTYANVIADWLTEEEKMNMARGCELAIENLKKIKTFYESKLFVRR